MSGDETMLVHFVEHRHVAAFEAAGWTVDDELTANHHGAHGVMMSRPTRPDDTSESMAAELARLAGQAP